MGFSDPDKALEEKAKDLENAQKDLRGALLRHGRAAENRVKLQGELNTCLTEISNAAIAVKNCRENVAKAERALSGEVEGSKPGGVAR